MTIPGPATDMDGQGLGSSRTRQWWRTAVVAVLVAVATVAAPASILATWAHDEIGSTERYVDTVRPLASDPAVQDAVSERVSREVVSRIDLQRLTDDALEALAPQLPVGVKGFLPKRFVAQENDAVKDFVAEEIDTFVQSDAFERAWVRANRLAHSALVAVLTGTDSGVVEASGDTVDINIGPLIDAVAQQLEDRGMVFAGSIPRVDETFTIFTSDDIAGFRTGFDRLESAARWAPVIGLVTAIAAIAVARRRRTITMALGSSVAASMVLLGLAMYVVRGLYLDGIPERELPADAAEAIFDALVDYIRTMVRTLGLIALAVAVVAFLFGRRRADGRATSHGG